jgi:outer membrane lipoprotein LolB
VNRRRAAAALAVAGLSGCAIAPAAIDRDAGELLSGRLAVQVAAGDGVAARHVSGQFELQGNADAGTLNLVTPLGTMIAQARWRPGDVRLTTPQGESGFADLDSLSREVLGESLPLAALFDWLRGRPWPGSPSAATAPPDEPGFRQLGWTVSLARFGDAQVSARRDTPPAVSLRARLDRP